MYVILTSKAGQFRTEIGVGLRPVEAYDYVFYGERKAHFVIAELLQETKIRVIEEDDEALVNEVPSKLFEKFETVGAALAQLKQLTKTQHGGVTLSKAALS